VVVLINWKKGISKHAVPSSLVVGGPKQTEWCGKSDIQTMVEDPGSSSCCLVRSAGLHSHPFSLIPWKCGIT
jgi:hypothetical protein